jgi:hypothetical protein
MTWTIFTKDRYPFLKFEDATSGTRGSRYCEVLLYFSEYATSQALTATTNILLTRARLGATLQSYECRPTQTHPVETHSQEGQRTVQQAHGCTLHECPPLATMA